MRNRTRAGFLRVVHEVGLRVLVGVLADDLDRVLVRANGAVGPQSPKQRARDILFFDGERWVVVEAGVRHVILDADREVIPRLPLLQRIEDGARHRRREFLGGKPVAPANDGWRGREVTAAVAVRFGQRGHAILVEGFADRTRLFCAVEHGDALRGGRQRLQKVFDGKRTKETHLDESHLVAGLIEVLDGLLYGLGARTHHDDDALGVGRPDVVEQLVLAAGQRCQALHGVFDNLRRCQIKRVRRLTCLKVDVGVLRGAAQYGPLRR